jgi:hypothetical protein
MVTEQDLEIERNRINIIKQAQKDYEKAKGEHYAELKAKHEMRKLESDTVKEAWDD